MIVYKHMKKITETPYRDAVKSMNSTSGYMPRVSFSLKQLPQAKNWKVGKTYTVKMKIKQKGISENSAEFEITHIEVSK